MLLIGLVSGSVAWALAPFVGRSSAAGVAGALLIGGYVISGYATTVPALQLPADLSWFHWTAAHLPLSGEVRTKDDPQSSLFNTDGQIFSDVGIPVVLFMENYDINRSGYHDTHDTLENIDLDYGAALAAIAIETCAQAAQSS